MLCQPIAPVISPEHRCTVDSDKPIDVEFCQLCLSPRGVAG